MEAILDFSKPLDVNLFDQVVRELYHGSPQNISVADKVLMEFSQHAEAWSRVDSILQYSQYENSKVIGLKILQDLVLHKWQLLPSGERDGIKNFLVNLIIKLSQDEASLRANELFLKTLNLSLVQVLKQEWPHNWPQFIPEIVGSSKTSESLCENNMHILQLLSEEIFDFSKDQMVSQKVQELKNSMNSEFSKIYELCQFILDNAQKPSLVKATLGTLLKFLNWIPLGYIFETKLMENLLFKFFPEEMFRNVTLQCLVEIGSLKCANMYDEQFATLLVSFFEQLYGIVPTDTDFVQAYYTGSEDDKAFIQYLVLFLTGFFKSHLSMLEARPDCQQLLYDGHMLLAQLSLVENEDIFKICLEYWNELANSLYIESPFKKSSALMLSDLEAPSRRDLYAGVLSNVRLVMIGRMVKPEEVLIVQDENGQAHHVKTKDTAAMAMYKVMRDTLIFLTHLDPKDTERIMTEKLNMQMTGVEWSWHNLNSLCWAIGSISGAFKEVQEKEFLVHVIRNLLDLVHAKRGKDNKALIASDIMYIVGQYPRFLRAHWRFLKTVVNKLFEFMHEKHPGVKDMACETFLKIAQKCRRKFTTVQQQENTPFINDILDELHVHTADLEPPQLQVFYEAVGHIIQSQSDMATRDMLVARLFEWPNASWGDIMGSAAQSIEFLQDTNTMKAIANIIKTNNRAAMSLRHAYISQLSRIYHDLLNVFQAYSEMINALVQQYGDAATSRMEVRYMRTVKKDSLTLIQTFVERSEDPELIVRDLLPRLFEAVLHDYKRSIPLARDAEVLSLMTAIVEKLKGSITAEIPGVLDAVFECTLEMVSSDYDSFSDLRSNFFTLLRSINNHCFPAFFNIPGEVFKLIVDCMVWAMRHNKPEDAELGLNSLLELLNKVSQGDAEVANAFYSTFFLSLLHDVFVVLTDTMHKSGFKLQATLLRSMIHLCETGQIQVPLFDVSQHPNATDNSTFLREYTVDLLADAFQNLRRDEIQNFVMQMFALHNDLPTFKNTVRDFLISIKSFSDTSDNTELFLEEKQEDLRRQEALRTEAALQVPGLLGPYDPNRNDEG